MTVARLSLTGERLVSLNSSLGTVGAMKSLVAVLSAVLLLLVAGCSGSDGDDTSSTDSTGNATSDSAASDEPSDRAEDLLLRVFEAMENAGTMSMDLSVSDSSGSDAGSFTASGSQTTGSDIETMQLDMTMSMLGMDMRMIIVDGSMYMNMGILGQDQWMEITPDDPNDPMSQQFDEMLESLDGASNIAELQNAVVSIEEAGEAIELDGVPAQPYEIVVRTSDLSQYEEADAGPLELPETLAYTLYVGPDDLPRRLVMDVLGTQMTQDMYGFGESLDIQAPSADEIVDQTGSI